MRRLVYLLMRSLFDEVASLRQAYHEHLAAEHGQGCPLGKGPILDAAARTLEAIEAEQAEAHGGETSD